MAIDLGNIPTGTSPSPAEQLQIRKAIGVGQTDAPAFLAQTLTGQSLTGTQATSLVDLSATWNTDGNPSLIYGRVTNTKSGATANLIDLGTFAGGSMFKVNKAGAITIGGGNAKLEYTPNGSLTLRRSGDGALIFVADPESNNFAIGSIGVDALRNRSTGANGAGLEFLGSGVLEQRNGVNAQAFRVYNSYTDASNYERLTVDFSSGNARFIHQRSGAAASTPRALAFYGEAGVYFGASAGSTNHWYMLSAGNLLAGADNAYDIGAIGANRPRNVYVGTSIVGSAGAGILSGGVFQLNNNRGTLYAVGDGVIGFADQSGTGFGRMIFGAAADTHPAIARDGAGIKFTGAAAGSTSWIKVPAVAVSALPSAATAGVGARSFVNDALTPVFGSAVTGGGAVTVPVYSTGSAWNVG